MGAGHAHVEVLRRFARHPLMGGALTLLTPSRTAVYSGMVPGIVAGLYPAGAADINVASLAEAAGAALVLGRADGLDLRRREVRHGAAGTLGYDLLSLDIGSGPNTGNLAGATRAIAVRPINALLGQVAALPSSGRLIVVGAGAAGVELTLALARPPLALTLIATDDILPGFAASARRRVHRILAARGVSVLTGGRAVAVTAEGVRLESGDVVAGDAVLWAAASAAPCWLQGSGLALDRAGFVRVDATLRALGQERVFAAGDVAAFEAGGVPHAGVYAVRAAALLAANLRAAAAGQRLRPWRPQRRALYVLSTADRRAVAVRGEFAVSGAWAWRLKDWLDRSFVARLNQVAAKS